MAHDWLNDNELRLLLANAKMDVVRWTHPKEYDDMDRDLRIQAENDVRYWTKQLNLAGE